MTVGEDKVANLARAAGLVKEAATKGAQLVALPVSYQRHHGRAYVGTKFKIKSAWPGPAAWCFDVCT